MEAILLALSFGLGAGFSPGPLMVLVISATLERGWVAGLRVACAPLITDLPIIIATLWFLSRVPPAFLSGIALFGGAFVVYLGLDTVRRAQTATLKVDAAAVPAQDLWRAVVVNALSPHPWLAWFTVLGPAVVRLWYSAPRRAVGFVLVFYGVLVGSKALIAALVAWSRDRMSVRGYRLGLIICGAALIGVGGLLLVQGSRHLLPPS